jgi:HK97 family phage major capsid protein
MHFLRSLKDSNNRPIFAEIGGKVPNTIYEFPVNMTENIATTDTTGKPFGVFGNFDYFLIGRRNGAMVIDVDPYSKFAIYQTQFRMVTRWGFDYGDVNAFCRIINA